ncbi:hypothetical protein GEV33_014541 [Tenebrio molitor]|uniref:Saccharopine dehydrogenase n=1 Tax=Tenebrio molitor TaxID=7067 RepID=A0A8J6H4S2_TENMO|nr:hypothetical protein GEV33_014548 [Tenebrio molitor]KAH0808249.1 hypothetical protein GEV33_014541 [Tenebrio molitor]
MQLKYHSAAQEKGIYIIGACGVDCIPTDLGVAFLQQKFTGTLNSVDIYLELWEEGEKTPGPAINYGTWESAVYILAHVKELKTLRRQLFTTPLPNFKPKLEANGGLFSHEHPSEEKIEAFWFSATLYGEGWKESLLDANDPYVIPVDRALCAKVKGRNPAYGSTCVCLVLSAITLITESDKMPPGGGVYPPGFAFAKTSLVEQLNENGVTFEIVFEKDLHFPKH